MIDKSAALISLRPTAKWILTGEDLEWLDTEQTPPSDQEIKTEIDRLNNLGPNIFNPPTKEELLKQLQELAVKIEQLGVAL